MKTFLSHYLNKYKRFCQDSDVKKILCNKSWQVFNNTGEKEIYIFQEDETLVISVNGNAIIAKWSFIPANKTILMSYNESSFLMKPFFNDDNLFVLQLDGTSEYSFLIDETKKSQFKVDTLNQLEDYIIKTHAIEIENKRAEEQNQKRLRERARQERIEEEYKENFRQKVERVNKLWSEKKDDILSKNNYYSRYSICHWLCNGFGKAVGLLIFIVGLSLSWIVIFDNILDSPNFLLLSMCSAICIIGIFAYTPVKVVDISEKIDKIIEDSMIEFFLSHDIVLDRSYCINQFDLIGSTSPRIK